MAENSKKPRLRFKGFTETWEQREFGKVVNRSTEMACISELPRVEYEDIISGIGLLNKDITKKQSNKSGLLFSQGDVLYGKLRPYLKNWLIPSFSGIAVGDFWVLKPENSDSGFIYRLIQTKQFDNVANQSTGTKMPRADWKLVSNTMFYVPILITEQVIIGRCFSVLDNLITLHQRKYDKFVAIKKALLEKMFPRVGKNVPEIRFKGFTETWEQREVRNTFKVTRGYVLAATKTSTTKSDKTPYPVYSSQTKDNGLMGYYSDYLFDTAITWTTDGANAGTVRFREGKFYCTNVCGVLLCENGYANKMVAEALNLVAWKYVSKVGNPKLMNNVMGEIEIIIPSSMEEQSQISQLLCQIDNLITLHQRQLERLKNIKSALLEKMFI